MSGGPAGRPARPRHRQGQGARPRPVDRLIPGWLGANDAPITDRRAPLALLGLGIGYLAGEDIAFPLTMALHFACGALGGLWIPRRPCHTSYRTSARPCRPKTRRSWAGGSRAARRRRRRRSWCSLHGRLATRQTRSWPIADAAPGHPPVVSHHARTCRALRKGRSPMYSRNGLGADPRLGIPAKAALQ